jgi:hypothetical protein
MLGGIFYEQGIRNHPVHFDLLALGGGAGVQLVPARLRELFFHGLFFATGSTENLDNILRDKQAIWGDESCRKTV